MKKNYAVIFQKAGNKIDKLSVVLFFSLLSCAAFAQSPLAYNTANHDFASLRGPFNFIANEDVLDAAPPVITYTALPNTCSGGNRVLTATITDADGVPTSGAGLPVLYWRINVGSYVAVTGVSLGSNQYSFTFGNGALPTNLISYYIVAQDNAGNVIAKPSGGAAGYSTNPPAVATDPTSPDVYVYQSTLTAGTYNVGASQVAPNFLTITDAINAYNNSCLSGAITFILMDASYSSSEVFPLTISNPGASASNSLTIKPNTGLSTVIDGSSSEAIFKLNGADYITIDGSNSGGATRNLTIQNGSTNLTSSVIWLGSPSASNGATNNTIKNCNIAGNASTTTYAGIISSSAIIAGATAEAANSNNSYINNVIYSSYIGILVAGPAAGEPGMNISTNTVGTTASSQRLGYRGISISNQTNAQVFNNTVQNISSTLGIGSDTDPTAGIAVSGVISGGNIHANNISKITNTNSAGWQAYGISLQATSNASNLKVYNNFIQGIVGNGSSIPANNGIGIALQSGGGYNIYFNSINLFTNQAAGGISSCIYISPAITGTASVDLRNNIFSNRRTSGTNYAIYCSVPGIIFSNINYNDYYSTSFLGYLGSNRANIAAWQAATGLDGNSVATNPIFVSTSNLHLQPISPLNDQGISIGGITTDIDAETRTATPDIGADDFTPPVCSGNTGGVAVSDFSTVCASGAVSLSASGFAYGLGIAYQWERSTDNFATAGIPISGETNPTSANPPVITVTTYYRLRVTCSAGTPGFSNVLTITVYNPAIASTTPAARCGPGTVSLSATGTAGTTIQWYNSATGGAPIGTGSPFVTPAISATTTFYAESTYLGSSGTVGAAAPSAANNGVNTQFTSWEVNFNVTQATKLLTVDVYPLASGENASIDIYLGLNPTAGGTLIASVPYTTNVSGGNTVQTISLNVPLPIGTYYMYTTTFPLSGLTRNLSGASYPYTSSDITITGNGFNPGFYMCYYRWRFSNGCSSNPRTAVVATVGSTATLNVTASPNAICAGSTSDLNVTSSNPSFTYTWLPGPLNGAAQTVSPTTTTTYTVNATDGTCTATGTVTITVNPSSSAVTIAPASVTKCEGSPPQLLTATGGNVADAVVISQTFNGSLASITGTDGWVIQTTGTTGNIAAKQWQPKPDGTVLDAQTFHSNDNSTFFLASTFGLAGIAKTNLQTPSFSLAGYTTASLYFYHFFSKNNLDSAVVEYASNAAGPWTKIRVFGSRGFSNNFRKDTINLTPYVGATVNYVRFRYFSPDGNGFYWALDNVSITGGTNAGSPITWTPIAGLFTNAAGTTPYTTGTASSTVYANPATTTTYVATATPPNACQRSQAIDVVIRPLSGSITTTTPSVCPSGAASLSVALTGTGPWSITYTDGTTPVTVNNITTTPYNFVVNPLVTTTYTLTALQDAYCTATSGNLGSPVTITVNATLYSTWIGTTSDWTDGNNWCGGVPTSTKDVIISSAAVYPVITGTTAVAHDISISAAASVTIDAGAAFSAKGNFVNNGTIINNGTITLNGNTAQSFPGGSTGIITAMNNVTVNNTAGVTINRALSITGTLTPTAGNITLDNVVVTLPSTITSTARIASLGATAGFTYNGTGKFSVERFISSATRTAWRFLSIPTNTTQTINQAWQEGQPVNGQVSTGYGMQIVGPASAGPGFDVNTATSSLKTYNPATNTWVSVPGTTGPIATNEGYITFIRGDRGANLFGETSVTTLRTAGPVKTGNVTLSTANSNLNKFISVGNPYPSAIDFTSSSTIKNGLVDVYYLWDPKIGVNGGYQTFAGPGYVSPAAGPLSSYSAGNRVIESGQAFFVVSNNVNTTHSITITENSKVASNVQVARSADPDKYFGTRLYLVNGSDLSLYDGVRVDFDPAFSNEVDNDDAVKLVNFGENLGLLRDGKSISVERRRNILDADTIFYQLGQFRQREYQFEFTPENIATPGLQAYLEDNYLHTSTVIPLDIASTVNFIVDGNDSSKAADRFRVVFRQLSVVPVTFTNVTAFARDKDIVVNWKVDNELNIDHYDIERSAAGQHFEKTGEQRSVGNNGASSLAYTWLDEEPFTGDNFYRIKGIGNSGDIKYSEVVKVNLKQQPGLISIYPNPVENRVIGLYFNNQPAGEYLVRLYAANGQLTFVKKIYHVGGSHQFSLPVPDVKASGLYSLEIILPTKRKESYRLLFK